MPIYFIAASTGKHLQTETINTILVGKFRPLEGQSHTCTCTCRVILRRMAKLTL